MGEGRKRMKLSKFQFIIILIIFAVVVSALLVMMPRVISEHNHEKGINAINNGNFEEAISYLEKSNTVDADDLIESAQHHRNAIEAYEDGKYIDAYEEARRVEETYPQYDEVQKMAAKSLEKLIDENLEEAKEHFTDKEYIDAYERLRIVLKYDPNQEEALQLKELYSLKAYEMEAKIEQGGYFVTDSSRIRQREIVNINAWNEAGYTGRGLQFSMTIPENNDTTEPKAAILHTILPDAVSEDQISGTSDVLRRY